MPCGLSPGTLATFVGWTQQSLAKADAAGETVPNADIPKDTVAGTVNAHPYQVSKEGLRGQMLLCSSLLGLTDAYQTPAS